MGKMYKSVAWHGALNDRTGYGIHGSNMVRELSKLLPVNVEGEGEAHISLVDVVSIQNINDRLPYPSVLYSVWESTDYPQWFVDRLKYFDQLWVPSQWQKDWSVAQGIPEEFIRVVPEGVDPEIFKPATHIRGFRQKGEFHFLHVGQWQPRKSTLEICQSFLKAFPARIYKNVRLYLSCDTLFPSDDYKSTEERLIGNGITDSRIIPVHFEDKDGYVRRLQAADCFVSCARAEGWGLPIIEAMACGVPTIVADWSGSTEYAGDALKVRVLSHRKPAGIYGNWDVPGVWGEPDYDHLVEVMRDAYDNHAAHKEKALATSEMIRTKFSWAASAKTAFDTLQAIPHPNEVNSPVLPAPEDAIKSYAKQLGYEILFMRKRRAAFIIDSHCDTKAKMDTLIETIKQVQPYGYPILLASHLPLPGDVISMADYYIYDKNDPMSPETDMPVYWRTLPDGMTETTHSSIPCHALAGHMNIANALDFCQDKFDFIFKIGYDAEVDVDRWVQLVNASTKPIVFAKYENREGVANGDIIAGSIAYMNAIWLRIKTWEEFAAKFGDNRFCVEQSLCDLIEEYGSLDDIGWIDIEVGNRFDQVDRNAWQDDQIFSHFMDGPFVEIVGSSGREYEVNYGNSIDGPNYYTLKQKTGVWSRPDKKFYRDWTVDITHNEQSVFHHVMDLNGKNVIISMGSRAMGDTIAWIPYVEEFRKKHNCNVYCSTWWNDIMDYPEIKFIKPGTEVVDVYATYEIGCYDGQLDRNVTDWRLTPLQKVSADILGIDYEPLRAHLKYEPHVSKANGHKPKPYMCFSEFSTMQNKLWNRSGAWQKVIDHCIELGYDCVSISTEPTELKNVVRHNGQPVERTLTDLSGAAFYVGLNHGPAWLAYALNVPTVMITGVSEEWNDFPNPYRLATKDCTPGCFNDPSLPIDRGWDWCGRKRDYICTRNITEAMAVKAITRIREDIGHAVKKGKKGSIGKHLNADARRPTAKAGDRNRNVPRGSREKRVSA